MNFYESNSYIWFLGRLFGLYYFTNDQNVLKITRKSLLLSTLPGLVFILIIIIAIFTVHATEDELSESVGSSATIILLVVSVFGITSQFVTCVVILIVSFNKREQILNFYKTVNKLDGILENKLNIHFDYEAMRNKDSKKLTMVAVFYICLFMIINYAYTMNLSYISIAIISSFTYGSDLFNSIDYFYSIKIIQTRFKSLNKLFSKTSTITPTKLKIMIESHFTLNRLITEMNKIHGFKKLLNITNDFLFIMSQLHAIFVTIDDNSFTLVYMKVLLGLLVMPVLLAKMIFTAKCCEETVADKKLFGKLLKKIDCFGSSEFISNLVFF